MNFLKNRFNLLLAKFLGVEPAILNKAVDAEIQAGACFEILKFPVDELAEFHLVQFFRPLANGRTLAGLGTDKVEERAYIKAIFEYFERQAVFEYGFAMGFESTNGVSAHRYASLARQAAINELYERDSFFRHWYSQTPFDSIASNDALPLKKYIDILNAKGIQTYFKRTFLGHAPATLCFLIVAPKMGFVLGLSAGRGASDDLEKAFTEAVVSLFFGHEGKTEQEQLDRIKSGSFKSLTDHRSYWLLGGGALPEFVLKDRQRVTKKLPVLPKPCLHEYFLGSGPVPIVGIKSPDLIDLEVGLPGESTKALLSRHGLSYKKLLPHPIP